MTEKNTEKERSELKKLYKILSPIKSEYINCFGYLVSSAFNEVIHDPEKLSEYIRLMKKSVEDKHDYIADHYHIDMDKYMEYDPICIGLKNP